MLELNHTWLDVWNLGVALTCLVYPLTRNFPNYEKYGLTAQLRRATVSIPSNILEGAFRYPKKKEVDSLK